MKPFPVEELEDIEEEDIIKNTDKKFLHIHTSTLILINLLEEDMVVISPIQSMTLRPQDSSETSPIKREKTILVLVT
jgi:hypothetical protein